MSPIFKHLASLALFLTASIAISQTNQQMPIRYGHVEKSMTLINPAIIGLDWKYSVRSGFLGHTGQRRNIRTTYISGHMPLSGDTSFSNHHLGITIWSDQEGVLLSQTAIYANYALKKKLSSSLLLSAGVSIGVFNYLVDQTDFVAGGSDNTLDGNIGIILSGSTWRAGISGNQIFGGELSPISESTTLARHINLWGQYSFTFPNNISITPVFLLRTGNYTDADIYLKLGYQNVVFGGGNIQPGHDISFLIGVDDLNVRGGRFGLFALYHVPAGNNSVSNSTRYELQMDLKWNKNNQLATKGYL